MNIININVGVLGHVDSGKTSLCKAISTISSTACFDKNPQSKERGITLDLGFSSFQVLPEKISDDVKKSLTLNDDTALQFTLVDCPGHASLIRTIICGAQIIDMMVLVIDIVKGIQTQTAECLVIGEILCNRILIVLNKIDLIPLKDREAVITKMKKKLSLTMAKTKFVSCSVVEISANPGGGCLDSDIDRKIESIGIDKLITELLKNIENPMGKRLIGSKRQLVFAIDHCFGIRGQGTVLTGTILSGSVSVGESLFFPSLELEKKIKSIQVYRKPVTKAIQGDRVGICVTQMDADLMERGLACHSAADSTSRPLHLIEACIFRANTISYYKLPVKSKSKFHFAIGQDTVMGTVTLFTGRRSASNNMTSTDENVGDTTFDWTQQYDFLNEYLQTEPLSKDLDLYVLVQLEKPVVCSVNSLIIGSKLDSDIHSNVCRLAFYGRVLWMNTNVNYKETDLPQLKVFKVKSKYGLMERAIDCRTIIVKNLFKKETNMEVFQRLKVRIESVDAADYDGDQSKCLMSPISGYIEGNFGQSGKCKVILNDDLPTNVMESFSSNSKRKKNKTDDVDIPRISIRVCLEFKRYLFDLKKRIVQ